MNNGANKYARKCRKKEILAYKNDERSGSQSFCDRWDDKLILPKMRTFHICCLFVTLSVSNRMKNSFLFQNEYLRSSDFMQEGSQRIRKHTMTPIFNMTRSIFFLFHSLLIKFSVNFLFLIF